MRGEGTNSWPDELLRSRNAGTGLGRGVARGLRGRTDFFERLPGLSFLGGDDRSDVVVAVVVVAAEALAIAGVAAVGAAVVAGMLVALPVVDEVTVVSCVLVVTVVVTVMLRGLVPGKDMSTPFIEKCCATRWVTPVVQQFC